MLVQEAIHSSKKSKALGMVVKLDMENDFNHVKHSFLFSVLKVYGFSENFISWIRACIGSPWISPLLNGKPSQFSKANRGLHQGFPLSPFLYILLVDTLNCKLEEERRKGQLLGLLIARGVKEITLSICRRYSTLGGGNNSLYYPLSENSWLLPRGLWRKTEYTKCRIYGWHVLGHIKEKIDKILGFPIITTWN
jgi:hypothetical protein